MERNPGNSLTFLGVAGSLRRGSYNRGLIRAAVEVAPPGTQVIPFELADIPMFDADLEMEGEPAAVARFKQAIAQADGLLIATPEYNHCVPGVLKNAIDWASRPARRSVLTGKPVAIMGASTGRGATARAQAHLRDGLAYTNGFVLPLPEVLVGLAGERFDEAGNLTDEDTRQEVRDLLVSLATWTRRLQRGDEAVA
ncbi:MAG TPA: NAD(P)H-dependent oxidoreductase, partial [Candidatus Saccharimonadales bacterium]|nr:NAD(P)H-dependent oxidoreductase [Candidatus Saccharimonadales bacterium]